MAIKGVKLNKKGQAVLYIDVYAQTDELKDAVNELPKDPPRPGFKSHSMGYEITEDITIPAGKYDIVMWKGFTKAGNPKMTINIGDHNPKYAQPSVESTSSNKVSTPPGRDADEDWLSDI